jgi:uncharacterized RDD family membrane protein YckC
MRSIDISTTQNVTIEYELATWQDRIFAFILDQLIMLIVVWILSIFFVAAFGENVLYVMYLVLLPLYVFHSLYMEIILNGQTFGKRAIGIKVVKLNGAEPEATDFLLRWSMRFLDIWFSLGTVASMLITSSPNSQRFGDMIAGTTIIKTKSKVNYQLKDIMKISTLDTYTPTYTDVTKFSEQDMMFVKQVIERHAKHPNMAHAEAMDALAIHMASILGIPEPRGNKAQFLKTLVNDFIVLTR